MAKRFIKIENTTKSSVTINLKNLNGRIVPIQPQGMAMIDEDELNYVMNTSQVFKKGTLKVANIDDVKEIVETSELVSANALNANDITVLLKKNQKDLKEALEAIDSVEKIGMIHDKAVELDKTVKVIEIIKERQEQLLSQ